MFVVSEKPLSGSLRLSSWWPLAEAREISRARQTTWRPQEVSAISHVRRVLVSSYAPVRLTELSIFEPELNSPTISDKIQLCSGYRQGLKSKYTLLRVQWPGKYYIQLHSCERTTVSVKSTWACSSNTTRDMDHRDINKIFRLQGLRNFRDVALLLPPYPGNVPRCSCNNLIPDRFRCTLLDMTSICLGRASRSVQSAPI